MRESELKVKEGKSPEHGRAGADGGTTTGELTSYAWQFMKYLRSGGDECSLPIMKRTDYLPTTLASLLLLGLDYLHSKIKRGKSGKT